MMKLIINSLYRNKEVCTCEEGRGVESCGRGGCMRGVGGVEVWRWLCVGVWCVELWEGWLHEGCGMWRWLCEGW